MTMERSSRDLLLASVRDSTDASHLRSLAEEIDDWDALIDLALQHRVVPVLAARLADFEKKVPSHALIRITGEYERIVLHNFASAAELIAVLERFDREGIQAMPYKGVVLAASVYGDMLRRPGGDLDFLIGKRDLAKASELIRERGYELQPPTIRVGNSELADPDPEEYTYIRPADCMVLELRWRLGLVWGRYRRTLGLDWVWPHRRPVVLSGAQVPGIDQERLLLLLCMHGSKHSWSRLIWVYDVAKLIASSPDLNWGELLKEARRQGLTRSLRLGVLLAIRMIGASVPPRVLAQFEADGTACRLAEFFASNLLERPGQGPSGRVPYWLQLLDFKDRARQVLSLNVLRPNQRDRAMVSLPRWLRPLYLLLRPLRLLWDRSAR